jgi:putative membrane protein
MRRLTKAILWAATAALAAPVRAHDSGVPHSEPPGWTVDPAILVPLAAAAICYAIGWRKLGRRSIHQGRLQARHARFFASGWLLLAVALISPLHQEGERSFAAHMFEHELIMLAAAPLLVLSQPAATFLWAFGPSGRKALGIVAKDPAFRRAWHGLTAPVAATLIQAGALWLWHMPVLFDKALASDTWHAAQHLSFLVSALFFWTSMLRRRTAAGVAAVCLVVTSIVSGALGALMAFATSPWYAGYAKLGIAPFDLTPAEDQQFAGLLMWVPGGLVHAGAALLVMRRMLRQHA